MHLFLARKGIDFSFSFVNEIPKDFGICAFIPILKGNLILSF